MVQSGVCGIHRHLHIPFLSQVATTEGTFPQTSVRWQQRRTDVTNTINRDLDNGSTCATPQPATVSIFAMSELGWESLLTDN